MENPTQAASMTHAGTDLQLANVENRYKRVRDLIFSTFDTLQDCYDHKHHQFPTSVEKTGQGPRPNFRDTAIVILAIQSCANILMSRADSSKPSFGHYKDNIFRESFSTIGKLASEPKKVLEPKWPKGPEAGPEAFTCALILEMLALESNPKSFDAVFVEAVETVLDSLTRSYPLHYAFGGASIMGTEPNGFVTYHALSALMSIVETMQRSESQHSVLAGLSKEILNWSIETSRERTIFQDVDTFKKHLLQELKRVPKGIGLWHVVEKLEASLKEESADPKADLAHQWTLAFVEGIAQQTEWMDRFSRLLYDLLAKIDDKSARGETASAVEHDATRPGLEAMQMVTEYRKKSGVSWKRAFFQGMLAMLQQIKDAYLTITKDVSIENLQQAIRNAAKIWRQTTIGTADYVAKLSKWATAELHSQIALSTVVHKTNFDPAQLAFLVRIYHDLAPEKNLRLVDKGLDVLFEAQQTDGTWPVGSPFWFDRKTQMLVYVANIEIINAVTPLLTGGLEKYHARLDRIFNWLETNRRKVELPANITVQGWSTDKISERGRIDVWMTAAVLRFLGAYANLLQEFIAGKTLEGRYDVAKPAEQWAQLIEPALEPGERRQRRQIKKTIFANYIDPFREYGSCSKNSMILYGPPGTSKSFIARAIARELDWKLVTITPSDFVKDGIEKSENMARMLFQDLRRLRNVVVLFDEIDEMLRSREDTEKPEGIAMLRFIVPGMLPKLQDLKQYGQNAGIILIIATNYQDRLDAAVKRKGRVDNIFAVLPPDRESRRLQLFELLKKRSRDEKEAMKHAHTLALITPGWVYAEMKQLVEELNSMRVEDYRLDAPNHGQGEAKIRLDGEAVSARGLNPQKFYFRRGPEAQEEALDVFEICCPDIAAWPKADREQAVQDVICPPKENQLTVESK